MLFPSYIFLLVFLPFVVLTYFALVRSAHMSVFARLFLVVSSLLFYGWFNPPYLLIILGSILGNYICAALMERFRYRRSIYITGVLLNLASIGYFKYYDFFITSVNSLFKSNLPLLHLLLPLGISFFTFQQLSYLHDIYHQKLAKHYSLQDYALFVTFFPQLIAGPIVLPEEMMSQFADKRNARFDATHFAQGLFLLAVGLGKKVLLADAFALLCDPVFNSNDVLTLPFSLLAVLSYTLQIYFDFSGYCDMALGLAWMFNIKLPLNFNSPYKSATIREFWQRWHITLGRFLTTFVYIPLGGSKKGEIRTCLNLLATFLVSGLWHGAGWLFIIWGFMHGSAMVLQRICCTKLKYSMPKVVAVSLTFTFVTFAWVVFRSETAENAMRIYRGFFNLGDGSSWSAAFADIAGYKIIAGLFIIFAGPNFAPKMENVKLNLTTMLYTVMLLVASLFFLNRYSPFIYFNF
jgi:alginate O-acetyltransferase complex protein AlgI